MKTSEEKKLENVGFLKLFGGIMNNLNNSDKPSTNEDTGAVKMQELLMGQLIANTSEEDVYEDAVKLTDSYSGKNALWQQNHNKILQFMIQYIQGKGKMPSKIEISHYTGISYQGVYEHLKDDETYNLFNGEISKVRLMSSVLTVETN